MRQVLDGMHQGVVVRDASGTIVDVNVAAEAVLGQPRADLIGRQSVNLCGGVHADGTPFPPNQSAASIALSTGRDVVGELVGLTPPGGELRWVAVNARALREGDAISGVVSTFVDVTEQQELVAALAESEKRFRLLAENASDLITSIDPDGVRTYVSPSCKALLGYEPAELIGRVAIGLVHPEDQPGLSAFLQSLIDDGPAAYEARFRH